MAGVKRRSGHNILRLHWPLAVLLAVGLAIGVQLGNDYGMSSDEPVNAWVGQAALGTYFGSSEYFTTPAPKIMVPSTSSSFRPSVDSFQLSSQAGRCQTAGIWPTI
jgi:hypothetical protein